MHISSTPLSLCNSISRLCVLNTFVINRTVLNLHRQSEILSFIMVAVLIDAYSFITGMYFLRVIFIQRVYTFQIYTLFKNK